MLASLDVIEDQVQQRVSLALPASPLTGVAVFDTLWIPAPTPYRHLLPSFDIKIATGDRRRSLLMTPFKPAS